MGETIAVIAVVGIVLVLAGRSLSRTFAGKGSGCGCATGSCSPSAACRSKESGQT